MEIINNIQDLRNIIELFISNSGPELDLQICASLRRQMRDFHNDYPGLYYFAFGLGQIYKLHISKTKFIIEFNSLTEKTRKFFCDYTGLKIRPNSSADILNEFSKYTNFNEWFELFNDALLFTSGEKEFINKHYDLQNKIHQDIIKNKNYIMWKDLVVKESDIYNKYEHLFPKSKFSNIYHEKNNDKYFFSIDMSKANFQIIKLVKLIDVDTWEFYIKKFIDHPYFGKLKKLRLISLSFPDLFPNKQAIYWKNLTLEVLDCVLLSDIFFQKDFVNYNGDEIIFETTKEKMFEQKKCLSKFGHE
ncbi:hypothetical protein QJ854_gp703 [Moumouvirus goulette]|uniref:Uncharacterized protein n=1 Tax=Moumouvirus goulette TaxID=1247379 RepID=M1PB26_9VIRU|nr:hypothetical protein QJ854_gp703 [Moumouvirus goulette]AGF85079.1 hypothetical protein glt_00270 [Moumouvirus goulette]